MSASSVASLCPHWSSAGIGCGRRIALCTLLLAVTGSLKWQGGVPPPSPPPPHTLRISHTWGRLGEGLRYIQKCTAARLATALQSPHLPVHNPHQVAELADFWRSTPSPIPYFFHCQCLITGCRSGARCLQHIHQIPQTTPYFPDSTIIDASPAGCRNLLEHLWQGQVFLTQDPEIPPDAIQAATDLTSMCWRLS